MHMHGQWSEYLLSAGGTAANIPITSQRAHRSRDQHPLPRLTQLLCLFSNLFLVNQVPVRFFKQSYSFLDRV